MSYALDMKSSSRQRAVAAEGIANLGKTLAEGSDTPHLVRGVVGPFASSCEEHEVYTVIRDAGSGYFVVHDADGGLIEKLVEQDLPARLAVTRPDRRLWPVVSDSSFFGFLVVERDGTDVALTADQEHAAAETADHLAIALECSTLEPHTRAVIGGRLYGASQDALVAQRALSKLAHDVRSPLSAIVMQVELLSLEDSELSPNLERALQRIGSSAEQLREVLEQRLAPSRAPLITEQAPLLETVSELVRRLVQDTSTVQLDIDADITPQARPERVQRIVELLLDNAQRHGDPPIRISAEASSNEVTLRVIDGGPGVPAESGEEIFQPFVPARVDSMAMGLPTARQLAHSLGGDLWLERGAQGACTFTLRLPRSQSENRDGE